MSVRLKILYSAYNMYANDDLKNINDLFNYIVPGGAEQAKRICYDHPSCNAFTIYHTCECPFWGKKIYVNTVYFKRVPAGRSVGSLTKSNSRAHS